MSIRNLTQQSVQPWKDIYCDNMHCNNLELDSLTIDNITVDDITISSLGQGVVHSDSIGHISSSQVVGSDIANNTIPDNKLQQITSANKVANSSTSASIIPNPDTIALRNGVGEIVGNIIGNASDNVLKTGDTMTGILVAPNITINTFSSGVVHSDSSGILTSSQIVGSDIANNTIQDIKLQQITSTNKVANSSTSATTLSIPSSIVLRDVSGNITGNITGSASLNVLKAGDTMTGTLILPNITINTLSTGIAHINSSGVVSSSLIVNADISASAGIVDTKLATISTSGKVANSATSGTLMANPDTLVLRDGTASFLANNIACNTVQVSNLLTGVVHANTGNLTGSLIVNADVSASAGIVDTKLATISTAGKVSNSATTSTTSNTASTIVLRDSSGNVSLLGTFGQQGTSTVAVTNLNRVTTPVNIITRYIVNGNFVNCFSFIELTVVTGTGSPEFTFTLPVARTGGNFASSTDIYGLANVSNNTDTTSSTTGIITAVAASQIVDVKLPATGNGSWRVRISWNYLLS